MTAEAPISRLDLERFVLGRLDDVGDARPDDGGEDRVAEAEAGEHELGGQRREREQQVDDEEHDGRREREVGAAALAIDEPAENGR